MRETWLNMKARKIGVSTSTDSLIPRRLSVVSARMTRNSAGSLKTVHAWGRTEKIASHPEAIEIAIVST